MNDLEELAEWVAAAASHLSKPDAGEWLARIEERYAVILLALERCSLHRSNHGEVGLRIATSLGRFWWMSGRAARGRAKLIELLPTQGTPTNLWADGLFALAGIEYAEGRFAEAQGAYSQACAMYLRLGVILTDASDLAAARQYNDESRALGLTLGDEHVPKTYQGIIDAAEIRERNLMTDLESLAEWTAEAASHLDGPDQAEWLARLEERYVGILLALERCAMGWSIQANVGLRIAANLGRYWWMSGRASRGRALLNDLLTTEVMPTVLRADGLLALAGVDYADARYKDAKQSLSQACAMARQLGYHAGVAVSLNQLGMILRETGDLAAARQHHGEALALHLTLGDERGAVSCRSNLGVVALFEGNLDAAEESHEAALAERRRLGDLRGIASSIGSLATIARLRGDQEQAQEMHEEALAMRRELGDPWGVAGSLVNLCHVAIRRGDLARASDLLGEATIGFTKVGDQLGVCETLDARAILTAAEDLPAEAVRLFAVAESARGEVGAPLPPIYKREVDRLLAECKGRLDKKAFDTAWQTGCSPRYSPFPLA